MRRLGQHAVLTLPMAGGRGKATPLPKAEDVWQRSDEDRTQCWSYLMARTHFLSIELLRL